MPRILDQNRGPQLIWAVRGTKFLEMCGDLGSDMSGLIIRLGRCNSRYWIG